MSPDSLRWSILFLCCNVFWLCVIYNGWESKINTPLDSFKPTDGIPYPLKFSKGKVYDAEQRKLLLQYKCDPDNLDERGTKIINFKKKLNDYTKWHKKVMRERRSGKDEGRKYILCEPINGMGNMMQVFIPCILTAMVAKRAVVVDNVNNHFIPPDHWPFYTPPGGSDIIFRREDFPEFCDRNRTDKCYGPYDARADAESLHCVDLIEFKQDHKLYQLSGSHYYDYFGSMITANAHHRELDTLPLNWFQMMWDHFLPLKPALRERVDKFKRENFLDYTIALQMRVPVPTPGQGPNNGDHWFAPDMPSRHLFFQAAEKLSRSAPVPYDRITWYLGTQDKILVDWFRENRPQGNVVWYEHPMTVAYDMKDISGKEAGIITFYLMSESDDLILTDFSSFGHTAAGRGGIVPVACNHRNFCARRLSAEPCQQTPHPIFPQQCMMDQHNPMVYIAPDLTCSWVAGNRQNQ